MKLFLLPTSWTRLILAVMNVKCTILLARTEAKVEAKRKSAGDSEQKRCKKPGRTTIINQT